MLDHRSLLSSALLVLTSLTPPLTAFAERDFSAEDVAGTHVVQWTALPAPGEGAVGEAHGTLTFTRDGSLHGWRELFRRSPAGQTGGDRFEVLRQDLEGTFEVDPDGLGVATLVAEPRPLDPMGRPLPVQEQLWFVLADGGRVLRFHSYAALVREDDGSAYDWIRTEGRAERSTGEDLIPHAVPSARVLLSRRPELGPQPLAPAAEPAAGPPPPGGRHAFIVRRTVPWLSCVRGLVAVGVVTLDGAGGLTGRRRLIRYDHDDGIVPTLQVLEQSFTGSYEIDGQGSGSGTLSVGEPPPDWPCGGRSVGQLYRVSPEERIHFAVRAGARAMPVALLGEIRWIVDGRPGRSFDTWMQGEWLRQDEP